MVSIILQFKCSIRIYHEARLQCNRFLFLLLDLIIAFFRSVFLLLSLTQIAIKTGGIKIEDVDHIPEIVGGHALEVETAGIGSEHVQSKIMQDIYIYT